MTPLNREALVEWIRIPLWRRNANIAVMFSDWPQSRWYVVSGEAAK